MIGDFSENYSFILQDASQGYHWNNVQATVHPFVAYYVESGKLLHVSYVVLSDCLQHDTVAVHLFQRYLIEFLKEKSASPLQKIFYFSDSQYKNRKNFINLCHHTEDFGVQAEWHFSATSHGKGACDGVGGTVKRLAARASLQRPYDEQIMTPRQLFEWAVENLPTVTFEYCSMDDYQSEAFLLGERFQKSCTIPGTRKLHAFIPSSGSTLSTKVYSMSPNSVEKKVTIPEGDLFIENLHGFVTCLHREHWWVGCIIHVDEDTSEVILSILNTSLMALPLHSNFQQSQM